MELLLETVEAVCKSRIITPWREVCASSPTHNVYTVDISYENLIGVLADQVDTQFEVAIGAFCLA